MEWRNNYGEPIATNFDKLKDNIVNKTELYQPTQEDMDMYMKLNEQDKFEIDRIIKKNQENYNKPELLNISTQPPEIPVGIGGKKKKTSLKKKKPSKKQSKSKKQTKRIQIKNASKQKRNYQKVN